MIAAHFPPLGGAAVQRNLQLARHLPDVDYRPVVITRAGTRDDFRWTPPDPALVDRHLPAVVHRLSDEEPSLATPRVRRWLRVKPQWERWWTAAIVKTAVVVGAEADVIHASVAPFLTANAAIAVARKLDKPLVVDLEDPWALDDMLEYTSGVHRTLEVRGMQRVLRAADTVVMNTSDARTRVLKAFPELDADRVVAIPNTFDPLDFANLLSEPRRDGHFRIVHTGSLHTDRGLSQRRARPGRRLLGGAVRDVDFLPRSHVYLLQAVSSALEARPELKGVVEVHLAGVFTSEDRAVAARYSFVRLHEFLPHDETIALIRSADLLFLPLYDIPPGRRAGIVPHKTYEYIGSRRPILGAVPDGDARDLLAESGAAVLCRPADADAIRDAVLADVEAWAAGSQARSPHPEIVARCSSHRLISDLAAVYDQLIGARGVAARPSPGVSARVLAPRRERD